MKTFRQSALYAKRWLLRIIALAIIAFSSGPALAVPAVTISNTSGLGLGNPPFTLGWQFTATDTLAVDALGLFDSGQDGFIENHQIGVWNSSGVLLASTFVTAGTTNPLINQFRYSVITPLILAPGQYQIGALYETGFDPLIFPGFASGFATAPGITFDAATFGFGATLANPTLVASSEPGYFGPNFNLAVVTGSVPEPGTLALASLALLGMFAARKRN